MTTAQPGPVRDVAMNQNICACAVLTRWCASLRSDFIWNWVTANGLLPLLSRRTGKDLKSCALLLLLVWHVPWLSPVYCGVAAAQAAQVVDHLMSSFPFTCANAAGRSRVVLRLASDRLPGSMVGCIVSELGSPPDPQMLFWRRLGPRSSRSCRRMTSSWCSFGRWQFPSSRGSIRCQSSWPAAQPRLGASSARRRKMRRLQQGAAEQAERQRRYTSRWSGRQQQGHGVTMSGRVASI